MSTELTSQEPTMKIEDQFTDTTVRKGLKVLNSPLLTDQGRHWLTRALDPFHDLAVDPCGYPDLDTTASVVQEINLSLTVSQPTGTGSSGLWDAHIFNWKDFAEPNNTIVGTSCTYNPINCQYSNSGAGAYIMSGLQVMTGPTGANLLPKDGSAVVGATAAWNLNPNKYLGAKCRVVAMGFEVINTTAELYKQGLVTAYRMPQQEDNFSVVKQLLADGLGGFFPDLRTVRQLSLPPATPADALILPGAKQWGAERGYYGVMTQSGLRNDFKALENVGRLYLEDGGWTEASQPLNATKAGIISTVDAQTASYITGSRYMSYYNTSGAYFTGLSAQTTLQVNLKVIVESSPGPKSPFATMARSSPRYDPEALRLYSELSQRLPVGVPVDMNPDGEWFRMVLGTLGDLSTMASGINPIFGLVGQGLKLGAQVAPGVVNMLKRVEDKEKQIDKKVKELKLHSPVSLTGVKPNNPNKLKALGKVTPKVTLQVKKKSKRQA